MLKGMLEGDLEIDVDENCPAFKMGDYILILEPNTDGDLNAGYIVHKNGELYAMFNDLFLSVEYFKQVVNLHSITN